MGHSRVVDIMRRAEQLPLVKDYLLGVQKNNLLAVNEGERAPAARLEPRRALPAAAAAEREGGVCARRGRVGAAAPANSPQTRAPVPTPPVLTPYPPCPPALC